MLKKDDLVVVGIGASAGGLAPIETFVQNIIPSANLTYVITQHLDPNQPSMLVEILSTISPLPVSFINDGEKILTNRVYICPPKYNVTLHNHCFKLISPLEKERPTPSINTFFSSLAIEQEDKAVGIIFSGIGNDGTEGIRKLKDAGSITIAQDEKTAQYPSMPHSAIKTKYIDFVLPPDTIASELESILNHPLKMKEENEYDEEFNEIFDILAEKTDTDFSDYKISTIFRRIKRRMIVCKKQTLKEYIDLLKNSEKEVLLLHKELLVIVTSFFRDKESFDALEKTIEKILLEKKKDDPVRIWITGCATGEEAYSVAIIFHMLFKKYHKKNKIQIFATDISSEAIEKARSGTYVQDHVQHIDPTILKLYFTKHDKEYKISKEIRDLIIFSKHDLIKDPPFLNMDLITCRNLLIYFNAELQKRIFSIFFNVLNKTGFLFLGKSESTLNLTNLFLIVDNKWKLFKKDLTAASPRVEKTTYYAKRYHNTIDINKEQEPHMDTEKNYLHNFLAHTILEKYIQNYIIINRDNYIIYSQGDLEEYMKFPKGGFTQEIFSFLKEFIRVDVRIAVLKARREQEIITVNIRLTNQEYIQINAIPIVNDEITTEGICITFKKHLEYIVNNKSEENDIELFEQYNKLNVQELEQELIETKSRLQSAIEELETSNEELQSTNEELQSSNEELQSTNEELETSNEELQSTNEELTTVNQELEEKTAALRLVNKDLANIFKIIEYGVIILDEELKIRKYTSYMEKISTILYNNIDHSITEVNLPIDTIVLKEKILYVMESGESIKFEQTSGNLIFWITIIPYIEGENQIQGSVLSFMDITKIKENEKALHKAKLELENINNNLEEMVDQKTSKIKTINKDLKEKNRSLHDTFALFDKGQFVLFKVKNNKSLTIDYVSESVEGILGYTKGEILDLKKLIVLIHEDDKEIMIEEQEQAISNQITNFTHTPYRIKKTNGQYIWVLSTVYIIYNKNNKPTHFLKHLVDISAQKNQEELIKKQKKEFETIFRYSKDGIAILSLDSQFLDFNDAYLDMTGFSEKELHTKRCIDLTAPEYLDKTLSAFKEVLKKGFYSDLEKVCIVQGGRRITAIMTLTLMPDKQRILLTAKDITSFKMLEAQAKLASMGEMIGNIAHQWRQPLSIITTSASGLKLRADYNENISYEEISEFSDHIVNQANYLSKTIDDFKNFIKGSAVFTTIDTQDILANTLNLTKATLTNNYIKIIEDTDESITINGNINELEQALINIINNAKDAIKEHVKNDDEKYIFISTKKLDNNSLELKICDSGGGIPDNILERIFEPYFTTKHQSVGTGLGLSMTHKIIVDRHHQNIFAHNESIIYEGKTYKGACFTILFKNDE